MPDPSKLLAGLGQAIREQRTTRNLSQEELGLLTGVHRNYIGGVERGERNPTLKTIVVLAVALGTRTSELVARAEELERGG